MIFRLFISILFIGFLLTGCSKTIESYNLNVETNPATLDPQFYKDEVANLIIQNSFESLVRYDISKNQILPYAAKDYNISDDGLYYNFTLSDELMWSNGQKVTAHDYKYSFIRMFDNNYPSKHAKKFLSIKNTSKILDGELDLDSIGITVIDDKKITFSLEQPDETFLYLLTTSPAMPCNQEFFEKANGKYGIDLDNYISNGPYVVSSWIPNKSIRLGENRNYRNSNQLNVSNVTLYIDKEENYLQNFLDQSTNVIIMDSSNQIETKSTDSYAYIRSTWGINFNTSNIYFKNDNIRKALALSLDRSVYKEMLGSNLINSNLLIPPNCFVYGKNYRESAILSNDNTDLLQAQYFYSKGLLQLSVKNLENISILAPDNSTHIELFSYISQLWQKELGLFISIDQMSNNGYLSRLNNFEYSMALVNIKSDSPSPFGFLNQFVQLYPSKEYYDTLYSGLRSIDVNQIVNNYFNAENMLLNNNIFLPLYYEVEDVVFDKSVQAVNYNVIDGSLLFYDVIG